MGGVLSKCQLVLPLQYSFQWVQISNKNEANVLDEPPETYGVKEFHSYGRT